VRTAAGCELVASVCNGSFLLAQAGLLEGLPATTHWQDLEELQDTFPAVHVVPSVRWTESGKIWTSAGIAAGIDMSLAIVARLAGMSLAQRTARQMDYRWQVDPALLAANP
jgi:transcriptional regulator GlxA family with amidase domain